jgi:hypothetical protein
MLSMITAMGYSHGPVFDAALGATLALSIVAVPASWRFSWARVMIPVFMLVSAIALWLLLTP